MDSVVEITEYRIYSIYIAEKIEWEKKIVSHTSGTVS